MTFCVYLLFHTGKDADAFHMCHLHILIHGIQSLSQAELCFIGRCEEAHFLVKIFNESVGSSVGVSDIETVAEDSSLFQHTECLRISRFFVREGMEAVK